MKSNRSIIVFFDFYRRVRRYFFTFFLLFIFCFTGVGQEEKEFEEVPVSFIVPRLGTTELLALIRNNQAFLPVKDLFDYLKINNNTNAGRDSVSGFFINRGSNYIIDHAGSQINYSGKIVRLSSADMILTETNLYLRTNVFGEVFGLNCDFSFRNLYVTLRPQVEIPAVREMQLEQLRKNLTQLKGEKKADTSLKRKFRLLQFGMADWSITSMQESKGINFARVNLALGATLAGGEAEANLNIFSNQRFNGKQQSFRWKYVNNNFAPIRQIVAGRIITQTVASIFSPINGVQFTNTPTSYRKSFGSYRYTGTTQPGWMVELYVNNILVDYLKADASGFYAFDIPMIYGNSAIRLKFFGPWGEEGTKEESIHIPFNFLPPGEFQYVVSAGVVDNEQQNLFSRTDAHYGLSKRVTIGGGYEYLNSLMLGKVMPFLTSSVRLGQSLIFNGEYMHNVRSKATLNYRPASSIQLDVAMIKYDSRQTAILNNYLQERKVSLTMPFRIKNIHTFSRFSFNQYSSFKNRSSDAEVLLSSVIGKVSSTIRTFAQFNNTIPSNLYTNLSLAFRLPEEVRLIPQVQYQYNISKVTLFKIEAEKRISHRGFLNITFENNPNAGTTNVTLGLRYNFSFAQTFFSARRGNGVTTTTQHARGSMMFEKKSGYTGFNDQSNVGKGGFIISPFLDINCNGLREPNEPKVDGLNVRVNGGRVRKNDRDTTLLIVNLEAYLEYLIELDVSGFDNIAWKIKHSSINVTAEPNQLKLILVPVAVMGEASGMVYLNDGHNKKGLGRLIVNFYDTSGNRLAQTLTETDGYFSIMNLLPGLYVARMDSAQLATLNLQAFPDKIGFSLKGSEEGAIADNFEFIVKSASLSNMDTTNGVSEKSQPKEISEPQLTKISENGNEIVNRSQGIQQKAKKRSNQNIPTATANAHLIRSKSKASSKSTDKLAFNTLSNISTRNSIQRRSGDNKPVKKPKSKAEHTKVAQVNLKADQQKPKPVQQLNKKRQLEMHQRFQKQQPQKDPYEKWNRSFEIVDLSKQQ